VILHLKRHHPCNAGPPGPLSVINDDCQPDEFMALEVSNSIII
jgi:hypothetical protein